jgi:fatty-acyl-CoA synthase
MADEVEALFPASSSISVKLLHELKVLPMPSESGSGLPSQDGGWDAIMQFTSGSTRQPKCVRVPANKIKRNVSSMADRLNLSAEYDVCVSWLPLHHDMGLIGLFIMPMLCSIELVLLSTSYFAQSPWSWIAACSEFKGTMTCAPNSAYGLLGRMLKAKESRLEHVRIVLNGSELIDPVSFRRFLTGASRSGLRSEAALCVYGLAEGTLGVTMPEYNTGLQTDLVLPGGLSRGRIARKATAKSIRSVEYAKVGYPLRGSEVRIVAASEPTTENRRIGGIEIRGESVFPGYLGQIQRSPHEWFDTGDLGYWCDEQLVVCGREKAVLVEGGVNYSAEHVEMVVGSLQGVRGGNAAAFSARIRGAERTVVMAEVNGVYPVDARLIREKVAKSCGVTVVDVILLAPGQLPKTSSGKIARSRCISMYNNASENAGGGPHQ